MLSIHNLTSTAQAKSYYENTGDYYSKDGGDSFSEWGGKGAETLGLEGTSVDSQVFEQLLNGTINKDTQLGRPDGEGGIDHKCGWDFTFSAPKSVSILALAGKDERLIEAHNMANKTAMKFLEENYTRTRKNESGKTEESKSDNLTYASFRHETSRALDAQLHTHNVIMNATVNDLGEWRSIESKRMYEAKMLTGLVYRSSLAKAVESLGYEVAVTNRSKGFFEIQGVPQVAINSQSKRRQLIVEAAKERGISSQNGFETAALMTRSTKQKATKDELQQLWSGELKALGFDPKEVINHSKQSHINSKTPDNNALENDVRLAYRSLATMEATFTEKALLKEALTLSISSASINDIREIISDFIQKGELKMMAKDNDGFYTLTTPKAIQIEQDIIKKMIQAKGKFSPTIPQTSIDNHIEKVREGSEHGGYTLGQEAAFRHALTGKDGVIGIQGLPGTGKTFMLKGVNSVANQNNVNVMGFAPTGSAAHTLYKDSGIESKTIDSFLYLAEIKAKAGKPILDKGGIWVVDESSLSNAENMVKLLDTAKKAEARIVLLGDKDQLGAVEWGKPFEMLQTFGMSTVRMADIIRQAEGSQLKRAVELAADGHFSESMSTLGDSVIESSKGQPLNDLVEHMKSLSNRELENTLVIIPDNKSRHQVMDKLREDRIERGMIDDKTTFTFTRHENANLNKVELTEPRFYERNDLIEFQQNIPSLDIETGSFFKVLGIDSNKGETYLRIIDVNSKKALTLNPKNLLDGADSKLAMSVYRERKIDLAKGDVIRWTKSRKDLGMLNGDVGTIKELDADSATIDFGDGKVKHINLKQNQNFDYGYAVTAYTSQGQTHQNAVMLAESNMKKLVNQKAYFVGISRAKETALIFTDNKTNLIKTIAKEDGSKTSTLNIGLHKNKLICEALREAKERDSDLSSKAVGDVKLAVDILAEKNAIFTHEELLSFTLKWGLGDYEIKHVEGAISHLRKDNTLALSSITTSKDKDSKVYTTGNNVRSEAKLVRLLKEGQNSKKQLAPSGLTDAYLATNQEKALDNGQHILTDTEANAVKDIMKSRNEITCITGSETSNHKDLIRNFVTPILQGRGTKVRSLVFTSQQKEEHDKLGFRNTNYVDSWLKSIDIRVSQNEAVNCRKEVWYVENATKMSTEQMVNLTSYARKTGARLLLSGNIGEKAVSGHQGYEVLSSQGVHTASLVNPRSSNLEINEASKALLESNIDKAIEKLSPYIHEVTAHDKKEAHTKRVEAIARTYLNLNDAEREQTGIIIPDKFTRDNVTDFIRTELKAEKKLSNEERRVMTLKNAFLSPTEKEQARFYNKSLIIEFQSERKSHDIKSKERFNVVEVDNAKNLLTLRSEKDGREFTWNPKESGNTRGRSTNVYTVDHISIAEGDKLRLHEAIKIEGRKNKSSSTLKSNDVVTIKRINETSITLNTRNGGETTISTESGLKVSHGYASSHFSIKDSPKENIIASLSSTHEHTTTKDNLLGALARTNNNFALFTDDKESMKKALQNNKSLAQSALSDRGISATGNSLTHMDKHGLFMSPFEKVKSSIDNAVTRSIDSINKARQQQVVRTRSL